MSLDHFSCPNTLQMCKILAHKVSPRWLRILGIVIQHFGPMLGWERVLSSINRPLRLPVPN